MTDLSTFVDDHHHRVDVLAALRAGQEHLRAAAREAKNGRICLQDARKAANDHDATAGLSDTISGALTNVEVALQNLARALEAVTPR